MKCIQEAHSKYRASVVKLRRAHKLMKRKEKGKGYQVYSASSSPSLVLNNACVESDLSNKGQEKCDLVRETDVNPLDANESFVTSKKYDVELLDTESGNDINLSKNRRIDRPATDHSVRDDNTAIIAGILEPEAEAKQICVLYEVCTYALDLKFEWFSQYKFLSH
jgi:hypothetical protein